MNAEPQLSTLRLFSDYMKLTGVPTLADGQGPDPALAGKRLGLINGATWITPWCDYFGARILPGVRLVSAANTAVQMNFMRAHTRHEPCPPQVNIDVFCEMGKRLVELGKVHALMITCSTMNRSYEQVSAEMRKYGVPVIQIDMPMMEQAVQARGKILVVATHGPTVKSTQALLEETAARRNKPVTFAGANVEEAFDCLGRGEIAEHNRIVAETITHACGEEPFATVVLAQLSMAVFALSYPDPVESFGIPVLNSAEAGFTRAAEVLRSL